jgi:hypothetical protein
MTTPAHRLYEQSWPEGEYRFFQIGFHVDDVIAAAERWARVHGVGPFFVLPRRPTRLVHRGVAVHYETQTATAQAGPVQIELTQQFGDDPGIFRDLFPADRIGLHQVCTVTHDFDRMREHYEREGYEIVGLLDAPGFRVAYVDTTADFGFFTEVVSHTPEFLALVAMQSEAAATWDGTDPVRLVTRDGYRTP